MDAYNQPISDVLKSLETSPEGLTHAQITERLEKFGLNELQEKKKAETEFQKASKALKKEAFDKDKESKIAQAMPCSSTEKRQS